MNTYSRPYFQPDSFVAQRDLHLRNWRWLRRPRDSPRREALKGRPPQGLQFFAALCVVCTHLEQIPSPMVNFTVVTCERDAKVDNILIGSIIDFTYCLALGSKINFILLISY